MSTPEDPRSESGAEGSRSDDPFDRPPNESGEGVDFGARQDPTAPLQPGQPAAYPGAYPGASPGSTPDEEGYWARQAREQGERAQAPQPGTPPPAWGAQQPAWGQQPPPAYAPYGQPPAPAGFAGGYGYQMPANHPSATTSLVLGLVGLVGGFMCGIGFLVAPFALFVGRKTVKEIDASNGQLGGRSNAQAGFVLGIVGTVILVLGVLAVIAVVTLGIAASSSSDYSTY
ncbi:hypothetical protein GCM10011519_16660 [Marmoricola endophyticus]|uniref:DUF4190 domain-containing protein n=1 Tax=Marmoricola endophyticus TaxID=2040280 RepID=A0A917BK92_9ACTN|nr:hypothetical protein [Marmoricola endophyticus]GGF43449.1 hypothetical protein GCM10011519_16660 [Marmoricola endophyticus]